MSHSNGSEWTDFGRVVRCSNNASLVHSTIAQSDPQERQLTSAMGSSSSVNKIDVLGGINGRTPTVFTPWISQVDATSFAVESETYSQPAFDHGGEDSWPSFIFSPEQMDYRQASVSVPGSTPSTPPLLYDTVTLGPMIDCPGVADLILDEVSSTHSFSKDEDTTVSSTTRIIPPPPAAGPAAGNLIAISPRLRLNTFGALKNGNVPTDSLQLKPGKDDQVKATSYLLPVNWEISDTDRVEEAGKQAVDSCANKQVMAVMNEEYLRNYRQDRHPNGVTLQKSDHMRRERDRRIALKLMYKTLDSMIPRPSKKSKRDRTAIVEDTLNYVKALQEKIDVHRVTGFGVQKSSVSRHRPLDPADGHENLVCSTSEPPRCSGDAGSQDHDQGCIEADSLSVMESRVDVFIGSGNEVLINISCRARAKLVSCILEALDMLCLDVHQYSFAKLLEELVHCNFRAKQKEASEETHTGQMIEEVLKTLLK